MLEGDETMPCQMKDASPHSLCWRNLSSASRKRLTTRQDKGDRTSGCGKCKWLERGCLKCILKKAVKYELKQLAGAWNITNKGLEECVATCIVEMKHNPVRNQLVRASHRI